MSDVLREALEAAITGDATRETEWWRTSEMMTHAILAHPAMQDIAAVVDAAVAYRRAPLFTRGKEERAFNAAVDKLMEHDE